MYISKDVKNIQICKCGNRDFEVKENRYVCKKCGKEKEE